MAASLTLTSAAPDALKYRYAYDGVGSQTAVRTQAQMAADAAKGGKGPLLELLQKSYTTPQWMALLGSPQLSLMTMPVVVQAAAEQIGVTLTQAPTAQMNVNGFGQSAGNTAMIEIRFHHTLTR